MIWEFMYRGRGGISRGRGGMERDMESKEYHEL